MDVAHPQSDYSSSWFLVELEHENVGFWGEGKTGVSGENLSEQRREPTTKSTNIWRPRQATLVGCERHPLLQFIILKVGASFFACSKRSDSEVWSEVLDWEKLNHDEKRKRKLGSLDLTPYPIPDVFPAHVSLHRPRNLSYTGRFAMTIFSATQRCNLFPFETSQQRCNAVLR